MSKLVPSRDSTRNIEYRCSSGRITNLYDETLYGGDWEIAKMTVEMATIYLSKKPWLLRNRCHEFIWT